MIETARLQLIPATVEMARAEIDDRRVFERLLGATVPENWPPETLADALLLFLREMEASPDRVGWFNWYAVTKAEGAATRILVASGGFRGPPRNESVEIGYSVLPQFQRRGFATEMVRALAGWAATEPEVVRVVAETDLANSASVRVLERSGFTARGTASAVGVLRFEFRAGE